MLAVTLFTVVFSLAYFALFGVIGWGAARDLNRRGERGWPVGLAITFVPVAGLIVWAVLQRRHQRGPRVTP